MTDRPGVRFAIAIPQHVARGAFDPAAFRAFMARAEELGFESAWTQEQVLGDMPNLGPLETMAYAAACSERIRLGCAVLVSTLHSPLHLAKSIATLDQVSGGRIEVGLGSGGRYRAFAAFDVDPTTFLGRFTEGLRADAGVLDGAPDRLRRSLLAGRAGRDGAQAGPVTAPADLAGRRSPGCAPAGHSPR